ncbi:MAG: AgmX/PglI C-terminal domain-containing protein [Bradymonadales bacterium]|jgi:hypothetical protein
MKQLQLAIVFQRSVVQERFLPLREADVSLGSDEGNTLRIEHAAFKNSTQLLRMRADGLELQLPAKMAMSARFGDEEKEIRRGELSVHTMQSGDWAILELGKDWDLVVRLTEKLPPVAGSPISRLSDGLRSLLPVALLLSLLIHGGLIFYAFWATPPQEKLGWVPLEARWVELITSLEEHREEEPDLPEPIVEDVDDIIIDDSNMRQDREKIDDKKSDIANLGNIEKPVGIQAALGRSQFAGKGMDSLFGSAVGLGDASDQMAITADGDAFGTGLGFGAGLGGMRGGGGGGGMGGGSIGSLAGGEAQKGAKIEGPTKRKTKIKPKLELTSAQASQFCKESNIRDVVSKRANALRNCYEQQLLADPQLSGKIVMMWKIGLEGEVSQCSVKSTTMKNPKVEACLERTIKRLRFDKPDGGICVIEFPFIFSASE